MKVYFDNAATTPLHPKVFEKMKIFLTEDYGNPSSIHSFGRKARVAVEEAREIIADSINARPSEIYFTSGGTEANNFSLLGIAQTEFKESKRNHIIVSKVEHHCILDAAEELSKKGYNIDFADVDANTQIDKDKLKRTLSGNTSLIAFIHVNNETGVINDLSTLTQLAKEKNIFVHTDAVQSFGKISLDIKEIGVDSLSASGHKINGPKGIGFSYIKSGTPISPLIFGGSQERNRRGGTENVAAIVGLAEAVQIAEAKKQSKFEHVQKIRSEFVNGIKRIDKEGIRINGGDNVLPFILSISLKPEYYKTDAEAIVMFFDINGIAVSNGSACTSGTLKPSHVIMNAGYSEEDALGTVRFSFGEQNNLEEVDYTLEVLKKITFKLRK